MAKAVSIQELRPGMMILAILEQNGPVKIRKSGMVTSEAMVQGLAEMGVLSLSIDFEQSVEIEQENEHVSQTQFVLNANAEQPKLDPDSHLSEQFNRSLFLPSLQAVPSAWQYYSKKIVIAGVIALGGFASGWLLGNYPNWLPNQQPEMANTISDESTLSQVTQQEPAEQSVGSQNTIAQDLSQQEVSQQDVNAGNLASGSNTEQTSVDTEAVLVAQSQIPTTNESTLAQSNATVGGNANTSSDLDSLAPENTESSQSNSIDNADGQISPELLQRFEQAMAELEEESKADTDDSYTIGEQAPSDLTSLDTVIRVDQLPARIMTRLPSMSFSAHMYATTPSERWVKVNDIELTEGEWITNDLYIEKIEPQHVILNYQGHQFSMRALSEW